MRGPVAALLLAGLVVLAGCGSALGGLGASPEPTPATATPVYVAAPGLSADGVDDPAQLARAHAASLRGQSYTVRLELVVYGPDGAERGGSVTELRVGPDRRRFRFDYRPRGGFPPDVAEQPRVEAYSNGTTTFERQTRPDETQFRAYATEDTAYLSVEPGPRAIQRYLAIGEARSVEETTVDGWIAYRVRLAEPDGPRTVEAVVDTFGLVHEVAVTRPRGDLFPTPPEGTIRYEVRYAAVGGTTVEAPPWLGEARRITRNQTYVGQG